MSHSFNRKWKFIIGILCFGFLVAGLAWLSSSLETARKIQACNNLSSFEGRLNCYIHFASLENDAAVCFSIPKVTAQEIGQLCSGQAGSTDGFCRRAQREDSFKEWYEKKILGKNKIREEMQDICLGKMAASTGDPSICHRMNTQNDWHYDNCLIDAGRRAGMNLGSSADICKKLEESARYYCLFEMVKKNGDATLCELIGESKNQCFFMAALAAKSHAICDNITANSESSSGTDFKNDCFVKTAILLGDIAICEKTTHPDAIKNCAWRVFSAKPEVFRTRESCDRLGDESVRYSKPEMHFPYFEYVGFAGGNLTRKEVCMNQLQAAKGDFSTCPNDLCKIAVAQSIPDEKLSVTLCKKNLSNNIADGDFDPELKKCTDRALAQQTDFSLCEVYHSMNIANSASARNECIGQMLDRKNGPIKTKSVSTIEVKHALDANPPKEDGEWMVYQNPVLNIQFRYPRHWGKLQWELDAESGYPPSDIEDIEALSFSWDGVDSHNFLLEMEKPSAKPGYIWAGSSYPWGCAGEEHFFCKESIENAKFTWYEFVGCMGGPCGIRRELTMVIDGVVFPRIHIDYQIPSTQDSEDGVEKLTARVKNMNFPDEEKKLLGEIDSFIDSITAY